MMPAIILKHIISPANIQSMSYTFAANSMDLSSFKLTW